MSNKIKLYLIIFMNFLFGIYCGIGIISTIFRFQHNNLMIIGGLCLLLFLPLLVLVFGITKNYINKINIRTNLQKRIEDAVNYSHFD